MSRRNKRVSIVTLGCPKNVVDTEVLIKQLEENNLQLTSDHEASDIVIINTCGFIQDAKQEIPEVDFYFGVNKLDKVLEAAGGVYKYELLGERHLTTPNHYAYLKISEGCDRLCSFCSIPLIRGKHVSKPIEELVQEARKLSELGVKELNLIAQDTTYYGLDLYGKRVLSNLIEKLSDIDEIEWIRILYAFPTGFPSDLLEQYKHNSKLCRYLDLPVQHISDNILSSMYRGITSDKVRALLSDIRNAVPEIALRTTLIVGYPNEREKEFEELLNFVEETQFERLGVFTYSQEEGTSVYSLGDPVPKEKKEERRNIIMESQMDISLRKNKHRVGTKLKVLIDQKNRNTAVGRTEWDAPEIDNVVKINKSELIIPGQFYNINVIDAKEFSLVGELNETKK